MSGSVNSASKRWQRMYALALLGSGNVLVGLPTNSGSGAAAQTNVTITFQGAVDFGTGPIAVPAGQYDTAILRLVK